MNKVIIIGNLTRDPELRTTTTGISVCSFTVAVNRRKTQQNQEPEADYFQVSAWRELGENCAKYLARGRKVCVTGPVSCRAYMRNDGSAGAALEIQAQDVEFLTPRGDGSQGSYQGGYNAAQSAAQPTAQAAAQPAPQATQNTAQVPEGFTLVTMDQDEFPF